MDGLFLNKIAGAVLGTCLALFVIVLVSEALYHPHELETPAYVIEVAGGAGGDTPKGPPPDLGALLAAADVATGARVAKKCVSCHAFEAGKPHSTGPNLHGVVGRKAAGLSDFGYSPAMKEYGEVWTYQNLYDYLEKPRSYIKGTAMTFVGLRDPADRAAVIAYMRSESSGAPPFPAPATPASEAPAESAAGGSGEPAPAAPASGGEPAPSAEPPTGAGASEPTPTPGG